MIVEPRFHKQVDPRRAWRSKPHWGCCHGPGGCNISPIVIIPLSSLCTLPVVSTPACGPLEVKTVALAATFNPIVIMNSFEIAVYTPCCEYSRVRTERLSVNKPASLPRPRLSSGHSRLLTKVSSACGGNLLGGNYGDIVNGCCAPAHSVLKSLQVGL